MDLHLAVCVAMSLIGISSGLMCGTTGSDILFVLDSSFRISQMEFMKQKKFVVNFINEIRIGKGRDQYMVGVLTYREERIQLGKFTNKSQLNSAILSIEQQVKESTDIYLALNFAHTQLFGDINRRRNGVRQVIFLITDGESLNIIASQLTAEVTSVFIIGVGGNAKKQELRLLATYPAITHLIMVDNYRELNTIKLKLVTSICPEWLCSFNGVDIVFVFESAVGIDEMYFQKELEFVVKTVDKFSIGSDQGNSQVAVITYSDEEIIHLNQFQRKQQLKEAIMEMRRPLNREFISMTRYAYEHAFRSIKGGRPFAKKVLILIVDGTRENMEETERYAKMAQSSGIHVVLIGVGIGSQIHIESDPFTENTFRVDDYSFLNSIQQNMTRNTCQGLMCINRGADIVFVLDYAKDSENEFNAQLHFISNVVKEFEIGNTKGQFQVAVMTYMENIIVQFNLNQFTWRPNLKIAILNISAQTRKGIIYTSRALKYARQEMFRVENGGRPYVDKVIILITEGRPQNMSATEEESMEAKSSGIRMVVVGVRTQFTTELERIASKPAEHHVFTVADYRDFPKIEKIMPERFCGGTNLLLSVAPFEYR